MRVSQGIYRRSDPGFQSVQRVKGTLILGFVSVLVVNHGFLFAHAFDSTLAKDTLPC